MKRVLQLIGGITVLAFVVGFLGFLFLRWIVPPPPQVEEFGFFETNGTRAESIIQIFRGPGTGHFEPEENWEPTDWDAKLAHPLTYVDPTEKRWDVPAGQINDGASVPIILHSLVGGGHNGLFLGAAIVHDRFCQNDEARESLGVEWEEVHEMFYYAMRASDVPESKAKIMYGAVACFGPPRSSDQWIRVLASRFGEGASRAKEAVPDWHGWSNHKIALRESAIKEGEYKIEKEEGSLKALQSRSVESERVLNGIRTELNKTKSATPNSFPNIKPNAWLEFKIERQSELESQLSKQIVQLERSKEEERVLEISLERERMRIEQIDSEVTGLKLHESMLNDKADTLFARIEQQSSSLSLAEIREMAEETAKTLYQNP